MILRTSWPESPLAPSATRPSLALSRASDLDACTCRRSPIANPFGTEHRDRDRCLSVQRLGHAELPARFDLGAYVELKRRWRVSIQALLYRARTLELISEPAFRRAMSRISLAGWRTGEPYSLGAPDEPTVLRSALELLSRSGDLSVLGDTGIPSDILDTLLPVGRFAHPAVN